MYDTSPAKSSYLFELKSDIDPLVVSSNGPRDSIQHAAEPFGAAREVVAMVSSKLVFVSFAAGDS